MYLSYTTSTLYIAVPTLSEIENWTCTATPPVAKFYQVPGKPVGNIEQKWGLVEGGFWVWLR